MKIALIRKNYTPYGGAENYLKLMARSLSSKGHDVHIFSSGKWPDIFTSHRIKSVNKPSVLSNILFTLNSRAALQKEDFDCILSLERTLYQDIYRAGDGCHREWLGKRGAIEPFVKKLSFRLNPHHLLLLYLEKRCFQNSGTIIANSEMVKKDIMRHYSIPDNKIEVVYNGVDLNYFRPVGNDEKQSLKKSLNINKEKVILFVGADFKRKGLSELLTAFARSNTQNTRVIIAGRKPKPEHISMVKSLGIERAVTFHGPEKNVRRLYAISDLFVLPTIYDPFSNATLEAMASGLPVITTIHNGVSELIKNGEQGYILKDTFNGSDLPEKISAAIEHSEELGRKARSKAEAYPIENAIDRITEIITSSKGHSWNGTHRT